MDDRMTSMPNIEAYRFGQMTIDGRQFTSDLVIFPTGRLLTNWIRKTGHFLEYGDIATLLAAAPEKIIIGTGASGGMKIDPNLLSYLGDMNIKVDIQSTKEAIDLYNKAIMTSQPTGACFHLTC